MSTVGHILSLHRAERAAYERLRSSGVPLASACDTITLWIWLECLGIDIVQHVNSCRSDVIVDTLVAEANLIIDTTGRNAPPPTDTWSPIRLTAELAVEVLALPFFWINRELVSRGLAFVRNGVGALVFDDRLNAMLSVTAAVMPPELSRAYVRPSVTGADRKTFLITIPEGNSMTAVEFMAYLAERWGQCVEFVKLERPSSEAAPTYGWGVFFVEDYAKIVFTKKELVKLHINGKTAFIRKYSLDGKKS